MTEATKIAIKAAKEGGEILKRSFLTKKNGPIKWKTGHSPVTDVDFESNEKIISILKEAFPDYKILSEELEKISLSDDDFIWVVDPLDGTNNFIAHIPCFAVSIALCKGKDVQLGVTFDPLHDELFVAEKGQGATLNGEPIKVSNRDLIEKGMLLAGRGFTGLELDRHRAIICELERKTVWFRRLGSAALMLAYVAAGRADATILTGDKPWDTAAGAILVKEAGGKTSDYCGREWSISSTDLAATNGHVHDELIEVTTNVSPLCS